METQTVVDTETTAEPVVDGSNAHDDLDTLLNEYDEGTQKVEQAAPPTTDNDVKEMVSYLRSKQEEEIRNQTQTDINSSITTIKDGLDTPIDLPDRVIRGLLVDKAENDPRFLRAWSERKINPTGYNKVLKAMQKEISKEFSNIDQKTTDDREAVVAAVRGATTTQPTKEEAPDYSKMSDSDFNRHIQSLDL